MTETVVVIEADRPVSEALDCFFQYPIHHLPVVRDGRLVGMLSSADVMKLEFFVPKNAADRSAYIDERFKIEQLMRQPVATLKVSNSLAEATVKLTEGGVHALPIVDDREQVIGMVTTTDIIRSLMHGPPRKGDPPAKSGPGEPPAETATENVEYRQRPTDDEFLTALRTAETLHVEARDPRYLGKAMLYLNQRCQFLERVLDYADRFLRTGQDEHMHAVLLKAIHAAKRADEYATGKARVPFPLE
ncbi:MAG TPA: CBS domain-containing protein [Steroidobacteraceae bacterium]|nr:CBS domain-containing protein [Steroidobacteraceae bacterium]